MKHHDTRLSLNPSVLLSPVSDGYVAYDTELNRLHQLNPTGALLVELFDQRTVEEVLALSRPLLPDDSDGPVRQWVDEAVEAKLLCEAQQAQESPRQLTAQQLADLASELRDDGKVQGAFLCQQQAVEVDGGRRSKWLRDLGELAHIVGKRDVARSAYERYVDQEPDDAEIRHLLTSLRGDAPPERVPDECIQQLYRRFSSFYEENMCGDLGYEGPKHLSEVIATAIGERRELDVLDLGCGTGLAGAAIADCAQRIVGVDLSPEMIELTRQRDLYDQLCVAEVTEFLRSAEDFFDLIMACDTFIYFGDLRQVLSLASERLRPGGVVALSVELADSGHFHLTDNGRYVHHVSHVQQAAESAGLAVTHQQSAFLRMEYGEEVTGLYVALTRNSVR